MPHFILGYPKGKPTTKENITEYSDLQSCASGTSHYSGIYADTLEKAKERLQQLADNNFEPKIKRL